MNVTGSLVLYQNPPDVFEAAIRSVLASDVEVTLAIVDNSPLPLASALFAHPRVRYLHLGANVGFGAGHNAAFAAVAAGSDVHVIINPDVTFAPDAIGTLVRTFEQRDVTAAMPAIRDGDGILQPLSKALPSPLHLFVRRFVPFRAARRAIDDSYEFRDLPTHGIVDIPNLSGCFLAVRSSTLARVNGFDERFFMYMEDIDLVRRLGDHGRTVYVPAACIRHDHARGSYRVGRLMIVHIRSAITYFTKWGWFRDPVRASRNAAARRRLATGGVVNRS